MMHQPRTRLSAAFLTQHDQVDWLRQTPGGTGIWNDFRFDLNGNAADADWLIVYDELKHTTFTRVPKARRVIVITEPPGIKIYGARFLDQFGIMLSPMPVPGFIGHFIQTDVGLPWTIGLDMTNGRRPAPCQFSYEQLATLPVGEKRQLLSAVISAKSMLPKHRSRVEFVKALADRLGNRFHHYGRGFRPINDKAEAILPYSHHLVIENNDEDSFFTEKITDAYLGWALPIFSGCGNIGRFFPADSMIRFDLSAHDAIERVVAALDEPVTEARLAAIGEARRAVLERYNLFARLADILGNIEVPDAAPVAEKIVQNAGFQPWRKRVKQKWKDIRRRLGLKK